MESLAKLTVFVRTFGCSFRDIPFEHDGGFNFIDAEDARLNSIDAIPAIDGAERACDHILTFINPIKFHSINVVMERSGRDDAIKGAAQADPTSSFVFIGSAPEVGIEYLQDRIVRVATRPEDSRRIISELLESLKAELQESLAKEYRSDEIAPDGSGSLYSIHTAQINKYAERFLQTGKDFFKAIQTATGPLPTLLPTTFRRSSQNSREDEARKMAADGAICVLCHIGCSHVLMKFLSKQKVYSGFYAEFALLYSIHFGQPTLQTIGIPPHNSHKDALRVVAMAILSGKAKHLDWAALLRHYLQYELACRLALTGASSFSEAIVNRHYRALCVLFGHSSGDRMIPWGRGQTPYSLPTLISSIPNEYHSICIDASSGIESIAVRDPSVCIKHFSKHGPKVYLELETHIYTTREVEFVVNDSIVWKLLFDVDIQKKCLFRRLKRKINRNLVYLNTNFQVDSFEFREGQRQVCINSEPHERNWIFHSNYNVLDQVIVFLPDDRRLLWSFVI